MPPDSDANRGEEESRFNVDASDLRDFDWQERLADHPEKDCQTYYQVFGSAATERRNAGDERGDRVFSFLNVVASFFPNFGSFSEPYRPMMTYTDGRRSLVPDDLTSRDLRALAEIVHDIEDAEFRARVADVLWVCQKDFRAAHLAVAAFLESAENLKTGDLWPPYIERLDRAAVIAAKKGFEAQRDEVVRVVESAIREFETDPNSGLLCGRLMGILLMLDAGDGGRYIALSERLARVFASTGEWGFAESYWKVAEDWHRKNKDEEALQRSMIEAAECIVSRAEADWAKEPPQASSAAHWMGRGLEALRRARADRERIREVHRKLLTFQKESLRELKPFGFDPESIPGYVEERDATQKAAIKHVSGYPFERAVLRFAHIGDPTDVSRLIEDDKKNSEGVIWDKLFGANQLDRDGKVADIMKPTGFGEGDPSGAELRKRLVQQTSQILWPTAAEWRLEPARRAIAAEHSIRFRDLAFLVTNNPLIREGHEGIFLRGIQAGFFGDWLVAMHLLVPQIEDSLRYVLQQHGEVTSTLKNGVQMEKDINELLWEESAEKIFGPDILFDLRGILIERFGGNLRNELAHGLMSEGMFYRAEAVYLWWLVIRLCWIGLSRAVPVVLPEDLA